MLKGKAFSPSEPKAAVDGSGSDGYVVLEALLDRLDELGLGG